MPEKFNVTQWCSFFVMNELFFELIQVAIGRRTHLSRTPYSEEWEQLFLMAERQTVLGVCFKAVREMADSVPQPVYMRWLAMAAKIQQRNEEMNRKCAEVYEAIRREGFGCVVLKGQGVARFYNESDGDSYSKVSDLGMYRQSGDIDVWLWKDGRSLKENRKEVLRLARSIQPKVSGSEHHVAVEWMGTDVELHYGPSFFYNPCSNIRIFQ